MFGEFWAGNDTVLTFPERWSQLQLLEEISEEVPTLVFGYIAELAPGLQISITNSYNPDYEQQAIIAPGQSYSVAKCAVKYAISLAYDEGPAPPIQAVLVDKPLHLLTVVSSSEVNGVFDTDYTKMDYDGRSQYIFNRASPDAVGGSLVINVVTVAVVDGDKTRPVECILSVSRNGTDNDDIESSADSSLVVVIELKFPVFTSSLQYDPDVAILVGEGDSDNGNDSDNDDAATLLVQILVPVLLGGCFLIVVVSLVVVVIGMQMARYRRRLFSDAEPTINSINF